VNYNALTVNRSCKLVLNGTDVLVADENTSLKSLGSAISLAVVDFAGDSTVISMDHEANESPERLWSVVKD
jgi:hypothetical protein